MPIRWTAEKDQNFLMLIIETVKVDYKTIATKWAERYPDEDKPTPKALEEHIGSLKRKAKAANGGKAVSTPRSNSKTSATTKSTPKRAAPKTPSSSAKRQKRTAMSDEDDSEDERNMTLYVPNREVLSRRRKSTKSYAESDEEEGDDGLDDIPFTSAQPERPAANSSGSVLDSLSDPAAKNTETDSVLGTNGLLGNRGSSPQSKQTQPKPKYDYFSKQAGDDSDNSDFNPMG